MLYQLGGKLVGTRWEQLDHHEEYIDPLEGRGRRPNEVEWQFRYAEEHREKILSKQRDRMRIRYYVGKAAKEGTNGR